MVSNTHENIREYLDYFNDQNVEAWLGRRARKWMAKHVEKDRKSFASSQCEDNIWIEDMKDMIHIDRKTYIQLGKATLTNKNIKYGSSQPGSLIFLIEYNPIDDHKICLFRYSNQLFDMHIVYDRDARYGEVWKNQAEVAGFTCQSERRHDYLYTFSADEGPISLKIGKPINRESDIELRVTSQRVYRFSIKMNFEATIWRMFISQLAKYFRGGELYSGHREMIPGEMLPVFLDEAYEPAYVLILFHRLCYHYSVSSE